MEEMTFEDMKRELKAHAKAVTEATATLKLRSEQLNELKPKRQKLEKEAETKWGVPISELPKYVEDKKAEVAKAITELGQKLKEAQAVE